MNLLSKIKEVELVFADLEKDVQEFKSKTGLGCLSGCGQCCNKPDIEATVLEFIPFAYHLFQEEKAEGFMDQLEARGANSYCQNFHEIVPEGKAGNCENYAYRGLVCRVFGYAASTDKNGEPRLATCKLMKTHFEEAYIRAVEAIRGGEKVPIINHYFMRLNAIDPRLTEKLYPINQAISLAIQYVSFHFTYAEE